MSISPGTVGAVTRPRPLALLLAAWTVLVWTTRIRNVLGDDALDGGAKAGRVALSLSFTALAVIVAWAALRRVDLLRFAVLVLAGWTVGVWVARAVGIVRGDHSAAFVVVHLVLAVVSIALSWLAVRAPRSSSAAASSR